MGQEINQEAPSSNFSAIGGNFLKNPTFYQKETFFGKVSLVFLVIDSDFQIFTLFRQKLQIKLPFPHKCFYYFLLLLGNHLKKIIFRSNLKKVQKKPRTFKIQKIQGLCKKNQIPRSDQKRQA